MDIKKWIFKAEELINTPSRNRLTEEQEVAYRQFAASLISDLGQSLQVYPYENHFIKPKFRMRYFGFINNI